MKFSLYLVLLIVSVCLSHIVFGEDIPYPNPSIEQLSPNYFPENIQPHKGEDRFYLEFFNMLMALGLLIVVLLIGSWFLKRLLNTRVQQMNATSSIKIIDSRSLSTKSMIYLLEVQGKEIAVAESLNGITLLSQSSPDIEINNIKKEST